VNTAVNIGKSAGLIDALTYIEKMDIEEGKSEED
jgi:hypothetical protein